MSSPRGPYNNKWESDLGVTETEKLLAGAIEQDKLETEEAEKLGPAEATYNSSEVVEIAKQDLNMLAGLAMPTVFEFLYPKVLLAAWHLLTSWVQDGKTEKFPKIALGIPRGHGKTTLIKLFVLYCILFTKRQFILVFSDTQAKAEGIISDVIDMLEEGNIQRLFGYWKLGIEKDTQQVKKFGFRGRPIILAAIGSGGSVRGLNLKNARPDVMIFDDVQSKECSESDVQSAALERWMVGTAMKAKSPKGCLYIFAGNMFPGPNSLLKKLKGNANWIKFISGAILADGSALWPELHPLETLVQELDNDIAMGHPEIFFSEVLNDTDAGINSSVDLTRIKAWPWKEYERPQGRFIIIDPASGKNAGAFTKKLDAVAIGYVEVYDETPALRDCIEEELSPGNTIRSALLLALRTGTRVIAVEATSYQSTLLYWFGVIAEQLQLTGFHFVEIQTGGMSKNARITNGLKSLTAGEIVIHPDIRSQIERQIVDWNPMKRDNTDGLLDLIAYIPKVLTQYGSLCYVDDSVEVIEAGAAEVPDDNHAF